MSVGKDSILFHLCHLAPAECINPADGLECEGTDIVEGIVELDGEKLC